MPYGRFSIALWLGVSLAAYAGGLVRIPTAKDELAPAALVLRPLPAPSQPPNAVPLSPAQQLGKDIFYDDTLSNPAGYSCATCHVPETGFTAPSSGVNQVAGPIPGVVPGRAGRRKPLSAAYAAFSPRGPFFDASLQQYVGGNFWDGRAPDTAAQALMPFLDPNEMDNTATGPYPPYTGGHSELVTAKLSQRPYARLWRAVYGRDSFERSTSAELYILAGQAIAAYEASAEVSPFSSKYDAVEYGTESGRRARFSADEEYGRQLFLDRGQCFICHSSALYAPVENLTGGRELFTLTSYVNIGVPRNPANPFYVQTDAVDNPLGCNLLGERFIDYGLGANPNPSLDGAQFMLAQPGDIPAFRGLFRIPSLRNVDARPSPGFVRAYMHNGVFKSLEQIVHFYNKRNIAVNAAGRETAFDLRIGPPAGFTRLFPPPEVLDNVQNVAGVTVAAGGSDVASNGVIGNLRLTPVEEAQLVSFLKTLTDGYTRPARNDW